MVVLDHDNSEPGSYVDNRCLREKSVIIWNF